MLITTLRLHNLKFQLKAATNMIQIFQHFSIFFSQTLIFVNQICILIDDSKEKSIQIKQSTLMKIAVLDLNFLNLNDSL